MKYFFITILILCYFSVQVLWGGEPETGHKKSLEAISLLRKHCWECHSTNKIEGELRLDSRKLILQGGSFGPAINLKEPLKSELLRRIALPVGDDELMPAVGEKLTKKEQQVIIDWINAGSSWPEDLDFKHWAYNSPVKPQLPVVKNKDWPINPIDYFILAKLEENGLTPSPPASKEMLIRRVYLDLTGLPPAPREVGTFLQDSDPQAYEKIVDKLLASSQYGERWARPWLDVARYADSHGYQRDDMRNLWPYRDWVIKSLNDDMPFSQFTIEQIAGDLLPNPTESQLIATGFNRCSMTNVEAGTDPEENRTNQVLDRVNTLSAVWLGSTLECCQCHNHKYDPFSQQDYYQLYAFYNNTAIEADRSNPEVPGSISFLGPEISLKSRADDEASRALLTSELTKLDQEIDKVKSTLKSDLLEYTSKLTSQDDSEITILKFSKYSSLGGATPILQDDNSILFTDEVPEKDTYAFEYSGELSKIVGFKLETLTDPSLPGDGPGRSDADRPNFVLNEFSLTVTRKDGSVDSIPLVNATADFSQNKFSISNVIDNDLKTGWAINPEFHKPHWATFETKDKLNVSADDQLTFTLIQNYGGGKVIGKVSISAILNQMPANSTLPTEVSNIIKRANWHKNPKLADKVLNFRFSQTEASKKLLAQQSVLKDQLRKIPVTKTLVMQELANSRDSYIFNRGIFSDKGENVSAKIPQILQAGNPTQRNRLDLAHWLVDRQNPLTARVNANRIWAEIFGRGIVSTVEDFGLKGDAPTHPELLDYLANEFMEPTSIFPLNQGNSLDIDSSSAAVAKPWSLKNLIRFIVTSATYRQTSDITPELLEVDDQNKLLARGPRFRMDAEMIRDNALTISGLISLKQFGEPIKPYQPDGLWTKIGGNKLDYIVSPGTEKYRRGIYVVWKRAALYPSFVNFDATPRLACTLKRSRSNTPLQALTLLNDPVYTEAALALAKRIISEAPSTDILSRIQYGFKLSTARLPTNKEINALSNLYETQLEANASQKSRVKDLLKDVNIPSETTNLEFAAWYAIATTLLNLDETMTKR